MQADDRVYVKHMLDSAQKARAIAGNLSRANFDADETVRLALTHLLQVIGEAARRVSPAYQKAHPQIPWSAVIGMRHKVVHDYLNVDEDVVWQTLQEDLPALIEVLAQYSDEDPDS
ncbi:MAG: DUF86 domain-containing protein [Chloroflexi bacterium]|nr:DUF86 domain-containing protein [Chloroflexota bacterium]